MRKSCNESGSPTSSYIQISQNHPNNTDCPAVVTLSNDTPYVAWRSTATDKPIYGSQSANNGQIDLTGTIHLNTSGNATTTIGNSGAGVINIQSGSALDLVSTTSVNINNGSGSSITNINAGTSSGAVNLGNATNAVYSLSVANNTGSGTTVDVLADTGQLVAHSSSRRFKENIKPVNDYGAAITQLNPVSFSYKNDTHKTKQIGLIAEEVEQLIPELVVHDKNGVPFSVKYSDLTTLLLYELQKQQKTITILSKEIADLKKSVRPDPSIKFRRRNHSGCSVDKIVSNG